MTAHDPDTVYHALERIFHEPFRLAIVTQLLDAPTGMAFTDLRDGCGLTDGNLSRHLKALEDAGIIRSEKTFVRNRPRTTVFLTPEGRDRFLSYLDALESALKEAAAKLTPTQQQSNANPAAFPRAGFATT